ncbi:hypothetical protein H4S14_003431 [Agrobacterium vitis]|nr:hypothetical protein [Agrobacterium vitis]MBE1439666.1 hypothetical protein [Agrobacterium vitis]
MTYQLRPEDGLIVSAKAVLTQQLLAAAQSLENPDHGRNDAVHRARRRLKRARALYRLIAAAAPEFRKIENVRLRDIARDLATLRDASALVETVIYLQAWTQSEEERQALDTALHVLTAQCEQTVEHDEVWNTHIVSASAACRQAAEALAVQDIPLRRAKASRILEKAWKTLLKKAHHAMAACHEGNEAESYHDLRKATQTYWMYLSLLRDLWPSAFALKRQSAKQLADQLGHEHDLSMLTAALDQQASRFAGGETLSHLLGIVIRQQQALRAEALAAAETLFGDHAAQEPAIIASLWQRYADAHQD